VTVSAFYSFLSRIISSFVFNTQKKTEHIYTEEEEEEEEDKEEDKE